MREEKKVVTWGGSREFEYEKCVDLSAPSYTLNYLESIKIARLFTDKTINLTPRAKARKRNQYAEFIRDHRHMDQYYKAWTTEEVRGLEHHTLVLNKKLGGRPYYSHPCLLCLSDLLVLGWIQRLVLINSTPECYYALKKHIIY